MTAPAITALAAWKAGRRIAAAYQREQGRSGYAKAIDQGEADQSLDVLFRAQGYQLALADFGLSAEYVAPLTPEEISELSQAYENAAKSDFIGPYEQAQHRFAAVAKKHWPAILAAISPKEGKAE